MDAEAIAIAAALRRRGDETVARLLRENDRRWRSLSPADRRLVEALAEEVASRLLAEPARRIERTDVRVVAELFALEVAEGVSRPDPGGSVAGLG
jgi:hypothetical protein